MSNECQPGAFSHSSSPFSKKALPFSRKDNHFSKKTNPFSRKDSPYSKQIICPFLLQENGWPIFTEAREKIRV